MAEMSKVIERIRKVIAKAEGTDNPDEAEMLMAKAHALLTEYNIDLVELETQYSDDPVDVNRDAVSHLKNDSWVGPLFTALSRYYGAVPIGERRTKNKTYYHLAGRESARVTVSLMFPFVKSQVRKFAKELVKEQPDEFRNERIAARRVANALTFRIRRLVVESKKKDKIRVESGKNALVPVDTINQVIKEKLGGTYTSRRATLLSSQSAKEKADKVSLYQQAEENKQGLLR